MAEAMPKPPAGVATAGRRVKFVAVDTSRGGLPVKRKQVQHACESCRRKKRRCIHAEDSEGGGDHIIATELSPPLTTSSSRGSISSSGQLSASLSHFPNNVISPPNGIDDARSFTTASPLKHSATTTPNQQASDDALKPRSSRFVGDLNPEGIFMEAAGSASNRESAQQGDVGIWLSSTGSGGADQPSRFITARPPPLLDNFLTPFVKENCLTCVPPEKEFNRLRNVYAQKIHPLFPIVPLELLSEDPLSASTIVLKQLVSLAAGTDPETQRYLRLANRGSELLTPQDFSQALSAAIRGTLETSIITDRVLHIRALTILSLYTQPTTIEEADLPAQLGGRAIHHVQTLGLQVLRYDSPQSEYLENILCVVWALDRINAAIYGRPCLLHERDIGTNLDTCISRRPPCFRLMLSVVQWLDQVIELYRPEPSEHATGMDKIAFIDLPVFEAMIVDAGALKVPSSLVATVETFYHAVVILSCRLPRPGTVPAASTLPPPSANARRSLAAERIACAVPRDCLSPVPFIPYAMSLALSVEYRKMRHSRLPIFRARAMGAFKRNCEMLRNFSDHFWSANVVAGLGERVLKEMERAATTLVREPTPVQDEAASEATQTPNQSDIVPRQSNGFGGDMTGIDAAPGLDSMVDFSLVDAISGQDVFGHIDPNFNLNAVEDVLESTLDIGLPPNWGNWGQYAT